MPMMKIFTIDNKEVQIEHSCENECPECGDDCYDVFFIPDWMVHRCESCLIDEANKFHYRIEKSC